MVDEMLPVISYNNTMFSLVSVLNRRNLSNKFRRCITHRTDSRGQQYYSITTGIPTILPLTTRYQQGPYRVVFSYW